MAKIPNISLTLSNRPENVLVVRQMLTGLAELIGLERAELNDIVTAATEACNNVVLHAYGGAEGPLEVEVCVVPSEVEIVVRDRGGGMQQERRSGSTSDGIGLSVIETLATRSELKEDGGVEVRMTFATPEARAIEEPSGDAAGLVRQIARTELAGTVAIEAAPTGLALALLPRVLGALAARARFSVQALSDLRELTDSLFAAAAECTPEPFIGAATTVSQHERELRLRLGPLPRGAAERMLAQMPLEQTASLAVPHAQTMPAAGQSELLMVHLAQG